MARGCDIDGCPRKHKGHGLCMTHLARKRKHGDPLIKGGRIRGACSVDGCDTLTDARGYCVKHYSRFMKYGTTELPEPEFDLVEWIVERFDVGDCWTWRGRTSDGYAKSKIRVRRGVQRSIHVHRFVYEELVGPVPAGKELDHLCRNRACANPDHLEPVTKRENWLRGEAPSAKNARKVTCIKGHPFDSENTYLRPEGGRRCRECKNANERKRYASRRTPNSRAA